jgi:dipeptide transport system ATP-binding protein
LNDPWFSKARPSTQDYHVGGGMFAGGQDRARREGRQISPSKGQDPGHRRRSGSGKSTLARIIALIDARPRASC